jgi:hypothetical protein
MIALGADFLVFRLASGESLPLSVEMLTADLTDGAERLCFITSKMRWAARPSPSENLRKPSKKF